ncbi:MAG: VCBS repeat-containing protein [Planctomycetes bacterium]|nr:VCBS repeat-containing protein [Planctomycetota bacterium]
MSSPAQADLIGHWPLDDGAGTVAKDSAGSNDGTLLNMDPANDWVDGMPGTALEFDGVDDFVSIPNPGQFSTVKDFTWMAWIRTEASGPIIAKSPTGTNWNNGSKILSVGTAGYVDFDIRQSNGLPYTVESRTKVNDGRWHHVAVAVGVERIDMFVDGTSKRTLHGNFLTILNGEPLNGSLKIGRGSNDYPSRQFFQARIDDVRIYNTSLDANQLNAIVSAIDCNHNGVHDVLDTDPDCNANGIPDECDLNSGAIWLVFQATASTGNAPWSLAAALLDEDGLEDIAVANYGSNSVSIFRNPGDGTLDRVKDIQTGEAPIFVTSADVSGDGHLDLIAVNAKGDDIAVLTNLADGQFGFSVKPYKVGKGPASAVAADLDGDGDLDLAVAKRFAPNVPPRPNGSISLLRNKGSGAFDAWETLCWVTSPAGLAASDLDGDGDIDLAAASEPSLLVFLNRGDGVFKKPTAYPAGGLLWGIIAADLNRDGRPDLAAMNNGNGSAFVFLNRGGGTFAAGTPYFTLGNHISVSAVDLDRDGDLDLTTNGSILTNHGDGSFAQEFLQLGGGGYLPVSEAAVNLDGDALPDLIGSTPSDNTLSILRNQSIQAAAYDLNKNGVLDECDIRDGASTDLNANGVPDEAEPDCNGNRLPDSFEIATAASPDGNQNGIPDDCEDCDENGRRDDLDIMAGSSEDCNGNGVPDYCDLARGWFPQIDCADACTSVPFRRGDAKADGIVDIGDIAYIQRWVFLSGSPPTCRAAADTNADWNVDVSDYFYLFMYLFQGGLTLPLPGPDTPGLDPLNQPCAAYDPEPPPLLADFELGFECPAGISGAPGEKVTIELVATLSTSNNTTGKGSEAWSISMGAEGVKIIAISTMGTAAENALDFENRNQVVDPDLDTGNGPQGEGAVSGVLLSFKGDQTLPPEGKARVARITLDATMPQDGASIGRIFYVDGKKGLGQPVRNVISLQGTAQKPVLGSCQLLVDCNQDGVPGDACLPGGGQIPGNANQDGNVDQSDAVWLLEHLFLGTYPSLPCEGKTAGAPGPGELALLDFNGGGEIDLSDAVSLLSWRFLGGSGHPLGSACARIPGCPAVCAP